jgi:hypothetical protein
MKFLGNSIKANHPETSDSPDGCFAPDDVMHRVCDPALPDAGEVWGGVVEDLYQWWESLVEAV